MLACRVTGRARFLVTVLVLLSPLLAQGEPPRRDADGVLPVPLSPEHLAAVKRTRRIMVNNDVGAPPQSFEVTPEQWVAAKFSLFDEPGSQVDCISWCLDEGNYACYPSKVLPELRYPGLKALAGQRRGHRQGDGGRKSQA